MSNKAWRTALICNPLDYTQERLQKERLALLKCVPGKATGTLRGRDLSRKSGAIISLFLPSATIRF